MHYLVNAFIWVVVVILALISVFGIIAVLVLTGGQS